MISNKMILAISCVILLAGCGVIYCFNNNDYSVSFEPSGDEVRYTLRGFMPCDYSYRVYTNTDVSDKLYFYYDDSYSHYYKNEYQKKFFDRMETVLKARDYSSMEYVDAAGLKILIDNTDDASGLMIMIVSGSIPDIIIEAGESTIFTKWMANGGSVFWAGPEIGKYISHKNSYDISETGRPFEGHVNDGTKQDIKTITEIGQVTGFSLANCIDFGLEKNYPGSVCLSTCSSNYSSSSVMKYGNGRLFMIGGMLVDSVLPIHTALAEILMCGINEDTVIKSSESFSKGYGDTSGTIKALSGDILILNIGKPYSAWARTYIVP